MGTGNPQSLPLTERQQLARVQAAICAVVARIDGKRMSVRDLDVATKTLARLRKEEALLQSRAMNEPEAKAEPKGRTPSQWEAYDLLSYVAGEVIDTPCACVNLMRAAADGDRIGRHVGQGARWTGYLAAVTAIHGGRYDDPAVETAIRGHRSPTSIRSWLRAAGVDVPAGVCHAE